MKKKVFIVDDDLAYQTLIEQHLRALNCDVQSFSCGVDLLGALHQKPDLVVLDHELGESKTGLDYLRDIKDTHPHTPVLFITGQQDIQSAIQAMKLGAFDYIVKDMASFVRLRTSLDKLSEKSGGFWKRIFGI